VSPLRWLQPGPSPALALGALAQLAGFGMNGAQIPDARLFVVETIVDIQNETVAVENRGLSGACAGDSGGPLLSRNAFGRTVVIGILTAGSGDCRGTDQYVRTDVLDDWLSLIVGRIEPDLSCGAIGNEGRCFNGTAVRCADGVLEAEWCAATERQHCAWSTDSYACVAAADGPCEDVTQVGVCDTASAKVCVLGRLDVTQCEPGSACRRAASSGIAFCGTP